MNYLHTVLLFLDLDIHLGRGSPPPLSLHIYIYFVCVCGGEGSCLNSYLCVCLVTQLSYSMTLWTVACHTPLTMGLSRQE